EIEHDVGNIVGPTETADGDVPWFRAASNAGTMNDRPSRDKIDAHAVSTSLEGEKFGEQDDGSFRRRVCTAARVRHDGAYRAHVHDHSAAATLHVWKRRLR